MLPLIVRPALGELLQRAAEQPRRQRLGRHHASTSRRSPAASSACSAATSPTCSAAGACWSGASCSTRSRRSPPAISTSVDWLLFWRCCTFVGVCVEFVAAVAWLAELFPNPKQREAVVGYTQAFGSIGGLMVTGAYYLRRHLRHDAAGGARRTRGVALHADVGRDPGDSADPHPAVPAGIAGLAARRKRAGTLKRPSFAELFRRRASAGRRS